MIYNNISDLDTRWASQHLQTAKISMKSQLIFMIFPRNNRKGQKGGYLRERRVKVEGRHRKKMFYIIVGLFISRDGTFDF